MNRFLLLCLLAGTAIADDGGDTLRGWLAKAELVVAGTITNEPVAIQFDSGFARYPCDVKVDDVLKGDATLAGQTIHVTVVRSEVERADQIAPIKKDRRYILFLKNVSPDKPVWQTADFWFGVQPDSPLLTRSLKRVAVEMLNRTADFDIQCRKRDDRVTATGEGDRVVFDIASPSGIGGARVIRKGTAWPGALVLRLHLAGLESLSVTHGTVTLSASVLSHGGFAKHVQWTPDHVETLDPGLLRAFTADGQPTAKLPGKDGWFELTIPKAVLKHAGEKLEISWIDFYR